MSDKELCASLVDEKEKAKPVPSLEFDLIPTVWRWYE
jgi:hypothetical protein